MTKQDWIKVEDKLPEDNQIVLTYGYGCADNEYGICQAFFQTGKEFGHWQELDCCGDFFLYPPTHWMPMPKSPKEE